ncbi:hypothetical protein QR97_01945 [Streptomyces sp. PBH53]|uniref:hypothetical protein n=1 Tax=Streptomyces sp. PBH53 TaxID=1577075 RepID=UPI000656713B|nr:hypothetical protein [Streptomyces sp. PBH53]AKN68730.1 hypothetical protein QR97_01945 [Streptomyces sp. PBH53]
MTALAVETPTPVWAGRVIVRAAGRMALHVAVRGATVPSTAMFTVPVECVPDAESAPGVRPWTGPVDEEQLCRACLRALHAAPPDPAPSAPARTARELVEPIPARRVRPLWTIPELKGAA